MCVVGQCIWTNSQGGKEKGKRLAGSAGKSGRQDLKFGEGKVKKIEQGNSQEKFKRGSRDKATRALHSESGGHVDLANARVEYSSCPSQKEAVSTNHQSTSCCG